MKRGATSISVFFKPKPEVDFPEESDNYAMVGFSFSPPLQHYVCWVDQDREWVDIIKEDYTNNMPHILCRTFSAHAFLGLFFQKYIFIQLIFLKRHC